MNAPDKTQSTIADPVEAGRLASLQLFKPEDIQTLGRNDLLAAQTLLGHGDKWGRWQTPENFASGLVKAHLRDINLADRLYDYLAKQGATGVPDELIEEGVITLTRLAVLMRLVPTTVHRNTRMSARV
jgi:hypothetical protein